MPFLGALFASPPVSSPPRSPKAPSPPQVVPAVAAGFNVPSFYARFFDTSGAATEIDQPAPPAAQA